MSINEESLADAKGIAEDGKQHGGKVINGCLYFFVSCILACFTILPLLTALFFTILGPLLSKVRTPEAQEAYSNYLLFTNSSEFLPYCLTYVIIGVIAALITFITPYLRKKGSFTFCCGIIAIVDIVWWLCILLSSFI